MIRPYYSKKLQTMTYNVDNEWRIPDHLRPSAKLLGGEDRVKGAVFNIREDAEAYNALLAAIAESDCDLSGAIWERAGVSWRCCICGNPGAGGKPQEWGFCRPCWQRHCRICGTVEPTAIAV